MTDIYKFATMNINGLASQTRLQMLEEFLRRQEIYLAFLEEVTHPHGVMCATGKGRNNPHERHATTLG
jgi:hypothetical protein